MEESNDLSERYGEIEKELEGESLEDEWKGDTGPPESYGRPNPRTVFEGVSGTFWMYQTDNSDARLVFDGEIADIEQ